MEEIYKLIINTYKEIKKQASYFGRKILRPKHSLESVAKELANGLRSEKIVLKNNNYQP